MLLIAIIATTLVAHVYSDCRNPSGRTCDWYTKCLEKSKPCGSGGYAIKYADHFCRRYEANINDFSAYGRRWVNAVKKCLQQILVPYLSSSVSCSTLKQRAFESHVRCYVDPTGTGSPSYCGLSAWDHVEVFNTIKGAFLSEFLETVSGGWDTIKKCYSRGKK